MGIKISCCDDKNFKNENQDQIEIEKIINEDKMRYPNVKNFIKKHYDQDKLKLIQNFYKQIFYKKKFLLDIELRKNVMIAEMKVNYVKDFQQKTFPFKERFPPLKSKKSWTYIVKLPPVYVENSDVYVGSWNYDKKFHGYGILYKTDGSTYEGFWEQGLMCGEGRFYNTSGDLFQGHFIGGCSCGYGEFHHSNGDVYKGEWLNDVPHGNGEEDFEDNSHFIGIFKFGKKVHGKFTWKDKSYYEGEFHNEVFHGHGVYQLDGRRYEGNWENGEMSGKGVFLYSDDSLYEGEFLNNKRQGYGKYTWNESKYYEGEWLGGKQHGKGIYYKNGKVIEGVWINGKLTNHKSSTGQLSGGYSMTESTDVHLNTNEKNIPSGRVKKSEYLIKKK